MDCFFGQKLDGPTLQGWGYLSRWSPSFSERRPWPAYRDWNGRTGIKTEKPTRHKSLTKVCLGLKTLLASSSHSLEINGPARTANLCAPVGYTSSAISTRVCSLRGRAQRTKSGTDSAARVAAAPAKGRLCLLPHGRSGGEGVRWGVGGVGGGVWNLFAHSPYSARRALSYKTL